MFTRTALSCLVAISLVLMIPSSMAHRAPGCLTTIKWNDASRRTEIIHRLHIHDAEVGVSASRGIAGLSVGDTEGRAHIALYVEEHFHIISDDDPLPLELVGAEISGNDILVYQEYPKPLPQDILIQNSILRDAFPKQVNRVNIEDAAGVQSLLFSQSVDKLSYRSVD